MTPAAMPERVSVIVPARNEERHIAACVRSILAQETDAQLEVIVADGRSSDQTAELARAGGARVVENPEQVIPTALNHALAAATGAVVIRFDAHSEMPPGYVSACLTALAEEENLGTVGGWRQVRADGPWGKALGAALASPLGIGYALRWRRPPAGMPRTDVDTVHFGCYPRQALQELGGWREDMLTNEDFELDYRLRLSGRRVVFDPAVWSIYKPRESFSAITRQYWRYGHWKAEMLAGAPSSVRPRQLAPPALVMTALAAGRHSMLAVPARVAIGVYASVIGAVAARSDSGWRLAILMPTIHLTWGSSLSVYLPLAAIRRASAGVHSRSGRNGTPARAEGEA